MKSYIEHIYDNHIIKYPKPFIAIPPVLHLKDIQQVEQAIQNIFSIMVSLPKRFVDNMGYDAFMNELGYSGSRIKNLIHIDKINALHRNALCRADLYKSDNGGWKLLEFNVGTKVGGITISLMNKALEQWNVIEDDRELYYKDTLAIWGDYIGQEVEGKNRGDSITIAFTEKEELISSYIHTLKIMADYLEQQSPDIKVIICPTEEIGIKGNDLFVNEYKIDYIYRLFDWEESDHSQEIMSLLEALDSGSHCKIILGPEYRLLNNKLLLALMSDDKYREYFSEEELRYIDEYIPYTRVLSDQTADYAVNHQHSLVVKPIEGYGGEGIYCGWEIGGEDWRLLIHDLINSSRKYILQARVVPQMEELHIYEPGKGVIKRELIAVWGFYMMNSRFSGGMVRGISQDSSSIINVRNGAVVGSVLLTDRTLQQHIRG